MDFLCNKFLLQQEKLNEEKSSLTEALNQTLQTMKKSECLDLAHVLEGKFQSVDLKCYSGSIVSMYFPRKMISLKRFFHSILLCLVDNRKKFLATNISPTLIINEDTIPKNP